MSTMTTSPATALAEVHQSLLKDLTDLESLVQSSARGALAGVLDRLQTLRADLAKHFRFEEENGYMQAVLLRAPQQERQVHRLREEHDELWQGLVALMWQAREPPLEDDFRQGLQTWIGRVRDHERRENLLVEEAFNTDVAAED